ncbi:MAG: gamma-glutamylcyclotransferase family protein [Vulcanimicrobiota bacterium]
MSRLFTYGTLAPGRPNAHILAGLPCQWQQATVRGRLLPEGWGAAQGFPGIITDPQGETVHGHLFTSEELPSHWARLDAFEGAGYQRVIIPAVLDDGAAVEAFIYALRTS